MAKTFSFKFTVACLLCYCCCCGRGVAVQNVIGELPRQEFPFYLPCQARARRTIIVFKDIYNRLEDRDDWYSLEVHVCQRDKPESLQITSRTTHYMYIKSK